VNHIPGIHQGDEFPEGKEREKPLPEIEGEGSVSGGDSTKAFHI